MTAVRQAVRMVSFDMDGTLIRGTTASLFMAERLGNLAAVQELERRFDTGEITAATFADAVAHSHLDLLYVDLCRHFDRLPLIAGIAETVAALRRRGIICVIATVSYAFYARVLAERFAFDGHCGAEMHELDGKLTGRMARHIDADGKRAFVEGTARRHGIAMRDVAHVGDSLSDLPTFAAVGKAIAINATANARAAAHHALDTDNLCEVLPLLGFPAANGAA
ncbi:MAG TPA: HAD-IB family phosphatase [Candidatus Sulfotelmatobacter sp.]|nr:HAD-IB family phosphatase [Candidatus Sulfotelmatobacter sp.]